MRTVSVFAACKSYRETLKHFDTLVEKFQEYLSVNSFGNSSVNTKVKQFQVLGETVEVSITPMASEFIIGNVEFKLILDRRDKPFNKKTLLQIYLNSKGDFGLELNEKNELIYASNIEAGNDTDLYITLVVLKNLLDHFGIQTH